jgi:hypothetical protein
MLCIFRDDAVFITMFNSKDLDAFTLRNIRLISHKYLFSLHSKAHNWAVRLGSFRGYRRPKQSQPTRLCFDAAHQAMWSAPACLGNNDDMLY